MPSTSLPDAKTADRMARMERVAGLLDSRFRLPLVGVRVGWDSILGIIPGFGDAITTLPAGWMIWEGYHLGARKRVLAKMGVNAGIDLLVGSVPFVGDVFDVAFKAHKRNFALLQTEMQRKVLHANKEEGAHA